MAGLEEIKNEAVDLENIPVEEVFQTLKCTNKGLSSEEAQARIDVFGPNKLEEKKESKILKFLGFMWNPLSWVMEAAAIMAIALANGGGRPPDWQDFVGIVVLLIINSLISYMEESNAGSAAQALMANLAPKAKVLRDGRWSEQEAAVLVPGDVISIKLGDIVPADARLLEGDPLKIDQSALTGESLPVTKGPGDSIYSGSTCKQGEIEAVVIATGVHTFFGKAAHLVDSTNQVGHFQKVLKAIGNFCIAAIAVGIVVEIIVMYAIQHRRYRDGIDNLLVLLIGGIPIAMPTVLSVTMAIGSHRLAKQGAITKRMTAIEEMAGMTVLCSDKTGTLTVNKLSVDKGLIEIFVKGVDPEEVILLAARASRVENQDAIDAAMVSMLSDPKEARDGIEEVHFLPFNPVDKRTALTYISRADGSWHRVSKGAPEQIMTLCKCRDDVVNKVHNVIDKYAERGLRSLAVARQEVPENRKDSPGGPWQFVALLPLFDPPRHDSAETIKKALNLGVNVKMITGDQLAIAKETGRRLGMGTNMYPSSALLGQCKDEAIASIPVDDLIEKADGFAGVFPEHKYEIVKKLQERKHICGMTGDGVNDAPALKKADIGIAVADATDAARSASDIVLTEPGLSVIISAVLTSRAIFQRMKNYTIYAVSITIRIVLGFMLIALIWKFDFSPFMILVIAILNDGTIMTISKDRVKPSPHPDSWKLNEIFITGIVYGSYLALMTVIFFWAMRSTDFFTVSFLSLRCQNFYLAARWPDPFDFVCSDALGTEHVRREVAPRQPGGDDVGAVPAGEHHQPGAHLRDALPWLVLHRDARAAPLRSLHRRPDLRHSSGSVPDHPVRAHPWHRVGMGGRDLALQRGHLPAAGRIQVRHPVCTERQGVGHAVRAQDRLHPKEGLRPGGAGGAVGDSAADAPWPADAGARRDPQRAQQLPRALGDRGAGQAPRRGGQAAGAQYAQGPGRVGRQAQGARHGGHPAALHRVMAAWSPDSAAGWPPLRARRAFSATAPMQAGRRRRGSL